MNRALFYPVHSPEEKLKKIVDITTEFLEKKQKLLILAKDEKSLQFLDELLWKTPLDGFLPHKISQIPCDDLIILTTKPENLNGANTIFNLTGSPLLDKIPQITKIYELEDSTTPEKKLLSEKRMKSYHQAGIAITSL